MSGPPEYVSPSSAASSHRSADSRGRSTPPLPAPHTAFPVRHLRARPHSSPAAPPHPHRASVQPPYIDTAYAAVQTPDRPLLPSDDLAPPALPSPLLFRRSSQTSTPASAAPGSSPQSVPRRSRNPRFPAHLPRGCSEPHPRAHPEC